MGTSPEAGTEPGGIGACCFALPAGMGGVWGQVAGGCRRGGQDVAGCRGRLVVALLVAVALVVLPVAVLLRDWLPVLLHPLRVDLVAVLLLRQLCLWLLLEMFLLLLTPVRFLHLCHFLLLL